MAHLIWSAFLAVLLNHQATLSQNTHLSKHHHSAHPTEKCGRAHLDGVEFQSRHECPVPADDTAGPEPKGWAPWTHPPYCTENRYCVYTNAGFRENHGISIITTPENLANMSNLRDVLFIAPPRREPDPPKYAIKPIPGKGIGVVATRKILRQEIIMTDAVSVLADFDLPRKLKRNDGIALFDRAMNQLANPEKVLSLARSSINLWAPASEDVMKTNSFGLALNELERMVIFPKISRVNHACDPNSAIRWTEALLENAVVALRDIEAGEEISISYTKFGLTYAERQSTLKSRWGFTCTCSLCTLPEKEVKESDRRREKIRELTESVLGMINRQEYLNAIKGHKEMIRYVTKERLTSQIGEHYWVLARLYSAAGDRNNAIKYARNAYKELKTYGEGGTELDETIKDLENFLPALKGSI